MKYLLFIFLIVLGSTYADDAYGVVYDEEYDYTYVEIYDVNYLLECHYEVSFTDGPDGVDAIQPDQLLEYDELTVDQGSTFEFHVQVNDPDYYLEYVEFVHFYNDGEDNYDTLYIGLYEDEGDYYFEFYYYNEFEEDEVEVEQLVPDSVNINGGDWVSFVVNKEPNWDGSLSLEVDGIEIYQEDDVFCGDVEWDYYDWADFADVYPYPDYSVNLSYEITGLTAEEYNECFEEYEDFFLLQKSHMKKQHHKKHHKREHKREHRRQHKRSAHSQRRHHNKRSHQNKNHSQKMHLRRR